MDKFSRKLVQDVIFEDLPEPSRVLKFVDELSAIQRCSHLHFPLVFDPVKEKKAAILGMFIVRPAYRAPLHKLISSVGKHTGGVESSSLKAKELLRGQSWAFNYKGLDGGWFLSNKNVLDAYRVALHYGMSDAVIVGTRTVAVEGVDRDTPHGEQRGYLWQPYGPTEWPHLKAACPDLLDLIMKQRAFVQDQGFLSHRKYPAQIVFTFSGKSYASSANTINTCNQGGSQQADFLEARIFTEVHPTGEPIECYIMTGEKGADEIRRRVRMCYPHLVPRIEGMLIVLPSKPESDLREAADRRAAVKGEEEGKGDKEQIDVDLSQVPEILFERFGMRIVNHDGGRQILKVFCEAGAVAQVNLTMCRKKSVWQVLQEFRSERAAPTTDTDIELSNIDSSAMDTDTAGEVKIREDFERNIELFFSKKGGETYQNQPSALEPESASECTDEDEDEAKADIEIPPHWRAVYSITDEEQDVIVTTFDTQVPAGF